MIEYINTRCNQWADWYVKRRANGLGFPKECPYTRLQARGGDGYQLTVDEAAWEIHQAINSLIHEEKLAVECFYLVSGAIEHKIQRAGCSIPTLYRRIDRAHNRIMEWLNDEAAGVDHMSPTERACMAEKESV